MVRKQVRREEGQDYIPLLGLPESVLALIAQARQQAQELRHAT